ncbi:MAG: Appr-1-p processing protein [Chloroflexia bacterium]|nr:Appr-1-p processing protein [Chloroflexia bacterium]
MAVHNHTGRGIALQFKHAYEDNYHAYVAACKRGDVQPGRMLVFEPNVLLGPTYIINFPTKRDWRGKSRLEDIDAGLTALVDEIRRRNIRSIAIPPLGSGLGGLDWQLVRPRIEAALAPLTDVHVKIYEPSSPQALSVQMQAPNVPTMTPARAALVLLIHRYLRGLMDPWVTLLEVHKLLYFMQEAGQPLKLKYQKGPYGPYAENLRHVLKAVEGHLVTGYADGGDQPGKPLELLPGVIEHATPLLQEDAEAHARFERVADLVEGFETPFGMELLATVHWVMSREGAQTEDAVINATYAWNRRKHRFSAHQILLARHILRKKGWFSPQLEATAGGV